MQKGHACRCFRVEVLYAGIVTMDASMQATREVREFKQRPSFVGVDDPELAAKIEAATQVTILGTTQGRLEDSEAKPLQPEAEVAVEAPTKMSTDGSKSVCSLHRCLGSHTLTLRMTVHRSYHGVISVIKMAFCH